MVLPPIYIDDEALRGLPPPVVDGSAVNVMDAILYIVIFYFGVMQQTQLDRNPHYVVLLGALFAGVITLSFVQEWLRTLAASPAHRRHTFVVLLDKLITYGTMFLTGIVARTIADAFTNGPHHGAFNVWDLVVPCIIVILLVAALYHITSLGAHRADISRALALAS